MICLACRTAADEKRPYEHVLCEGRGKCLCQHKQLRDYAFSLGRDPEEFFSQIKE